MYAHAGTRAHRNVMIGLIPYITGLILMAVKEYTWYNVVNYICAIFPPYTLLCGLFTMSNKNIIPNDAPLSKVQPVRD
jgi:hypothetical protein